MKTSLYNELMKKIHIADQLLYYANNVFYDGYPFYRTIRENLMHDTNYNDFDVAKIASSTHTFTTDELAKIKTIFEQAKKQTYYRYLIGDVVMFVIASDELAEIFKGTDLNNKYIDYLRLISISLCDVYGVETRDIPAYIGETIKKMHIKHLQVKLSAKSKTD